MSDFREILRVLSDGGVEFLLVGGAAATAYGPSRLAEDIHVVHRRTQFNIAAAVAHLRRTLE